MKMRFRRYATLVILGFANAAAVGDALAQDETKKEAPPANEAKPDSEKADANAADSSKTPEEEWAFLVVRKDEIARHLARLRKDFAVAERDKKEQIRDKFEILLTSYTTQVKKRMLELAPVIYKDDAENSLAAQLVVEAAFTENRFGEAATVADRLLEAGSNSKFVLNRAIVSHFATHNFKRATALLDQAREKDQLDPFVGGRYEDDAKEYVELWEKEQAIRAAEAKLQGDDALPRVEFVTSRGKIVIELFENEAPNTVANFINLAEDGTYSGTAFHRIIPGFMAQGGDPNSKDEKPGNDGLGGPGHTIKCECYADDARKHFQGSVSMAHSGKDTGGSQFFLTHLPTPHLNPNIVTETGHTVFGRVVEGMDVVATLELGDRITAAEVLNKRKHEYKVESTPDPLATSGDKAADE